MLRALAIAGLIGLVSSAALYDKDPNVEQLNSLNFHTVQSCVSALQFLMLNPMLMYPAAAY